MSILEKMLNMRTGFMTRDREEVMQKLMWRLYYEVAPRVKSGDTFTLFSSENDMSSFCKNNSLDIRALEWVIDEMRKEELIVRGTMPVILSQLGVEKFCVS